MSCPHCGAEVPEGNRFCPSCRKRVVAPSAGFGAAASAGSAASPPPPPRTAPRLPAPVPGAAPSPYAPPAARSGSIAPYGSIPEVQRPGVITLLAVLDFIGGGFALLAVIALLAAGAMDRDAILPSLLLGGVYAVLGVVQLATGIGLWRLQSWGRTAQIVMSFIGLLGIPCGTVISAAILFYLFKPGVKVLFSGRPPEDWAPDEAEEVRKISSGSTASTVLIVAVVVLVVVAIIGIIAAIAIPSLLRARVAANEAGTIGDLRTLVSAEVTYASGNGNFYDTPECLRAPATCVPGSTNTAPMVDTTIVFGAPHRGYVLTFHPGAAVPPEALAEGRISPSSVQSFAVTAVPVTFNQTGVRSFCVDDTGLIRYTTTGQPPRIVNGQCDPMADSMF